MDMNRYSPEFPQWLAANGHIWRAFEYQANRVWDRGRRHYSARTLIEVLRHESMLAEVGGMFKINNAAAPNLARLYAELHPDRACLFETRQNAKRAA